MIVIRRFTQMTTDSKEPRMHHLQFGKICVNLRKSVDKTSEP